MGKIKIDYGKSYYCRNCGAELKQDQNGKSFCPACGSSDSQANTEKKRVDITKCDGCGSTMTFDPETGLLKCGYCGGSKKISVSRDFQERDFSEFDNMEKWNGALKTVSCPNCGAVETYCETDVAKVCPFCKTPMVLGKEDLTGIKPNVVIPFKIKTDEAVKECKDWIKKRLFAPRKFKKSVSFDSVKGVYYPVWTFDSNVITSYDGVLGRTVTKTRTRNGKTETYTDTEYFRVSGQIFDMFDDIIVNAGNSISDSDIDSLKFSQGDYVDYSDEFLAGFSATGYTVKPQDAWIKAENKMKAIIKDEIMRRHNADTVSHLDMHLYHEGRSFKYMLVPFYISATKWKDKIYKQIIKGTGGAKIKGKTPVSPLRVCIAVLLGLGVLGLLIWLFMMDEVEQYESVKELIFALIK